MSRNGQQIDGTPVTGRSTAVSGANVIVTEGQGRDDNRNAQVRTTYTITHDTFQVSKDVRFADGDWFNRNELRLTR